MSNRQVRVGGSAHVIGPEPTLDRLVKLEQRYEGLLQDRYDLLVELQRLVAVADGCVNWQHVDHARALIRAIQAKLAEEDA